MASFRLQLYKTGTNFQWYRKASCKSVLFQTFYRQNCFWFHLILFGRGLNSTPQRYRKASCKSVLFQKFYRRNYFWFHLILFGKGLNFTPQRFFSVAAPLNPKNGPYLTLWFVAYDFYGLVLCSCNNCCIYQLILKNL